MNIYFKDFLSNKIQILLFDNLKPTLNELKYKISMILSQETEFIIYKNHTPIKNEREYLNDTSTGTVYSCQPHLLGGKGGFGSLLKGQQAVKKKTKNIDSCRDLQGRRIRDENRKKVISEYNQRVEKEKNIIDEYNNPKVLKENESIVPSEILTKGNYEELEIENSIQKIEHECRKYTHIISDAIKFLRNKRNS